MRFNALHGLGLAAFVVAAVAFVIARKAAPREADLKWHEGAGGSVKELAESPKDKTQRAILFGVVGLDEVFLHESKQPAFDTLRGELKRGAKIAVLYDPNDDRRFARAWSIKKNGRTLLSYADMAAWDEDNKGFGLGLAIAAAICGLILMVLGSKR